MPLSFREFLNFRRNRDVLLLDKPIRERHFISVLCSLMTIVCILLALSLQQWAESGSSRCNCNFGLTMVHCVDPSHLTKSRTKCADFTLTNYYRTSHEILISCILSISVLTMISSAIAMVISAGFPREKLEFLRHYSVFNIVSLLCIILVAGFWLAVINSLPVGDDAYRKTVRFGYAYYIYLASGMFTLIATCLNLLLAKTAAERRRQYRNRFRNRVFHSNNRRLPLPLPNTPTQPTSIINNDIQDDPPEYTIEATTSFINTDDDPVHTDNIHNDDTDLLITPRPPPYAP